jgi:hypothetical protein
MDLVTLHYITFVEPFGELPTDPLLFDTEQFTNKYTNNVCDSKNNDLFIFLEEHFFDAVVVYKENFEVKFENLPHGIIDFFPYM